MRATAITLPLIALLLSSCASFGGGAPAPSGDFEGLSAALAHERRAEDSARDAYRHPEETLRFFDVQPNHTVAEYAPGGGWYTRVIAPYVGENGRYVAVSFKGEDVPFERIRNALAGWEDSFPARVEEMTGVPADSVGAVHASALPEDAHGTVDRIIMPRMLHNLMRWDIADKELKGLRALLKDDGMIGIVQHRANPDAPYAYTDGSKGYLREADVVALMGVHGFRLVAKSEINANPADTADYEEGVWTLPPSFRLGDTDRAKYAAIGESDRATLLFAKAR